MVRIKVFRFSQLVYYTLIAVLVVTGIVLAVRAGVTAASAEPGATATRASPGPALTTPPLRPSASPASPASTPRASRTPAKAAPTPVPTSAPRASNTGDALSFEEKLSKPSVAAWLSRAIIGVDLTDPASVAQRALPYAEPAFAASAAMTEMEEDEASDERIDVELILPPATPAPTLSPDAPPARALRVLIYHTHTHEAYRQIADDPYKETGGKWRTDDYGHSIVHLGDALAKLLSARGMDVTHDKTNHEPPKLGTAYVRSLETLERYEARGERFDLYIDLHRDAYVEGRKQTAVVDGVECARLMMLIGNGEGSAGSGGFSVKPDWQKNYALASAVTDRLVQLEPDLCRPVMVKTGRYNQHISTRSILVEVGNNENTLAQCMNAMPLLADALYGAVSRMGPDARADERVK